MPTISIHPMDEHNQRLIEETHPSHWTNPEPLDMYHLVVIGGGPAGLVAAAGAASLGAKVALVEKHLMGGDCLNVGCVPSKCLVRAGRAAFDLKEMEKFGIENSQGEVNFEKVMGRMREIRASIAHHDSVQRFSNLGIHVFLGKGEFASPRTVQVGDKILPFRKAVIATGARAFYPPIPGLKEAGFLTNESVFSLTQLPKRLLVIGGGPIGCELSQAFCRLGSQVTIVEMMDQFLTREDPQGALILKQQFEKEGIQIHLSSQVEKVESSSKGKKVFLKTKEGEKTLEVDEILIGAGRVPNIDGLGLEKGGIQSDPRKGVLVNDCLQTSNPKVYAAGDIALPYKFTYAADFTARIVIKNALFGRKKKWTQLIIPWCTYTDPEIAHVGLYEHEAKQKGIPIDTYQKNFSDIDRALAEGDTAGFIKIHTQKGKDRILGATIVARHAGEMIGEICLAMQYKIGLGQISKVIHPYPTMAEGIRLAGDLYNRTRLTPFVQKMLKFLIWWRA